MVLLIIPIFSQSLKSILLRTAIGGPKHSNCMTFEADESPAIFSLKWTKNRTAIAEENDDGDGCPVPPVLPDLSKISIYNENILCYIGVFLCYMLYVICYMLYVICYILYVFYVILGFLFHENYPS